MASGVATHSAIFAVGPKDQSDRVYSGPRETIVLTGTSMGSPSDTAVAFCINSLGASFGPMACTVMTNTTVKCITAAGVGRSASWILSLNGSNGTTSNTLNTYKPPALTSLGYVDAVLGHEGVGRESGWGGVGWRVCGGMRWWCVLLQRPQPLGCALAPTGTRM